MRHPIARVVLIAGCLSLSACAAARPAAPRQQSYEAPPGTGGIMRPPGDPEVAVREQFEDAQRRNSEAAYRLFAERHPGHALARVAERRAERLRQDGPR